MWQRMVFKKTSIKKKQKKTQNPPHKQKNKLKSPTKPDKAVYHLNSDKSSPEDIFNVLLFWSGKYQSQEWDSRSVISTYESMSNTHWQ